MTRFIRSLLKDKKGIAALEYSILAALIVVAVATAASTSNIKTNITGIFTDVGTQLTNARK
ncbi:MAG: Flp family type IVb pilin [Bacteroidales bacterium]